jgi:hypothetical protein
MKITRRKCRTCGKKTASLKPGINHVGHFVASILTGGIWLPFWIAGRDRRRRSVASRVNPETPPSVAPQNFIFDVQRQPLPSDVLRRRVVAAGGIKDKKGTDIPVSELS